MPPSRPLRVFLCLPPLISACSRSSSGGPPALAQPANLRAEVRASSVTLAWQDLSAAEARYVVQAQDASGAYSSVASLPPDTTQFVVTGLTPLSDYVFRVVAEDGQGGVLPSAPVSTRTVAPSVTSVTPGSTFVVGGQRLELGGDGLAESVQQVLIGGRWSPFEVVSDTVLAVEMPAIRSPGLRSITVSTRYGDTELPDSLRVYAWPPVLLPAPVVVADPVEPLVFLTAGSGVRTHALWVTEDRELFVSSRRFDAPSWRAPQRVDAAHGRPFEPHLHADGDVVCAAWVDLGGLVYVISTDGGASFSAPARIEIPPSEGTVFHPQVLVHGEQISLFWVDARRHFGRTFVVRSMDRGATFGSVIQVNNGLEAEHLGVTSSGDAYYVANWSAMGGGSVHVSRSGDRGQTWSPFPVDLGMKPGVLARQPQICADDDTVHVAMAEPASGRLAVASSTDGGDVWGEPYYVDRNSSSVSSDPSIDCSGSEVCVAWHERQPTGRASVECNHSRDGGRTWNDSPRRLPQAIDSLGTDPQVRCDGSHVAISWVSGLPGGASRAYFAVSENRTASFEVAELGTGEASAVRMHANGAHYQLVWTEGSQVLTVETVAK